MRIIAGERRGAKLEAVEGLTTRPTADRVKEGLFNVIQMEIGQTTNVLDVFAGTGALGLEALSRGASHATFIEHAPKAQAVLKKNIAKCRYEARSTILCKDAFAALAQLAGKKFDLIFLDPPYREKLYEPIIFSILQYQLLNEYGILVSEHSKSVPFSWHNDGLTCYKSKSYGETVLNFFRFTESSWEET